MSNFISPQYPFDPTGTKLSNRVVGELQPLTGTADRDFYTVVPFAAPFYADSFSCSVKNLQNQIVPLVHGVDYYFTHEFMGATRATAKPVYGSITLLNHDLRGVLIINPYQCVGGDWMVSPNKIAEILASRLYNPRTVSWDVVAGYPTIFPPTPHEWNLTDLVGQSEVIVALNGLVDAILQRASDEVMAHINDLDGHAHGITPSSIGAVSVDQLQAALNNALQTLDLTTDKVAEGTNNKYFTESRVRAAKLVGYTVADTLVNLSEDDTMLQALTKLQANATLLRADVAKKADSNRPHFTGLGSQKLVKLNLNVPTLSIDLTQAEAYQVTVNQSGSIAFNITNLGSLSGDVVLEFALTTVNGATGGHAVAFPNNVDWVDGSPPPRSTAPGEKDNYYFWSEDKGVTWTGSLSNKNPT